MYSYCMSYVMYIHYVPPYFFCLSNVLNDVSPCYSSTMLGVIDAFFSYEVPRVIMNHLTTLCVGDHMVISDAMNTVDRLIVDVKCFPVILRYVG